MAATGASIFQISTQPRVFTRPITPANIINANPSVSNTLGECIFKTLLLSYLIHVRILENFVVFSNILEFMSY